MPDPQVLIVEDNPMNCRLFAVLLREAGFGVATAMNAPEALQSIARRRPDIVLTDVRLPGTDGLTLARLLRSDRTLGGIRIVVLTACATPEQRERALAAGCDGFITKPIDTRAFARVIARYLGSTR